MTGSDTSRQRTRLARLRTAAGFAVLGVFLLRQSLSRGAPIDLVAALLALASAAACASVQVSGTRARGDASRAFGLLTLAVLSICALAFAGALAGRS